MTGTPTPDTPGDVTQPLDGATEVTPDSGPGAETTSEKLEKSNRRFTTWRRQRAFGAGLLMILGGAVILTPAYLSLEISNIQIQISTLAGVSTLVIGILLIVCGLMTWFRGEGRILTGVAAMVLAIVALPQSNFGGFIIGTVLSLVGGAMALAWTPQSRDEARAEKKNRREEKVRSKEQKPGKGGSTTAVAAVAALAALTVGLGAHTPQASAQIPGLPELRLPTLPGQDGQAGQQVEPAAPSGTGATGGDATTTAPSTTPAAPSLQLPGLPELRLPEPTLPDGTALQQNIDGGLDALGVTVPGLNVEPPAPVQGLLPITGNTFTIKSDRTAMTPGMKLSVVTVDTLQGPKKAFRIDSDRTVLTNLRVQFPNGVPGLQDLGQDTLGAVTTLSGNFHIFVRKMTITAEVAGVDTGLPLTLDAEDLPDNIVRELSKLGLGLPDFLSGQTDILNGTMETYLVTSDVLEAPTNDIGPWQS